MTKPSAAPRVSIVVPVYRTPIKLLRRFFDSALRQTLEQIEVIAVDDASPDACPGLLDEYASGDPRMTVHHRDSNGRAGVARGDGLSLARAEYVVFADADDAMEASMCERLVTLASTHDADIVACGWSTHDINGERREAMCLPDGILDLSNPRQRSSAYRMLNFALWNKLFRRDVIQKLEFEQFEANIGEDTLFNIVALCESRIFVSTSYIGYKYTEHASSATGKAMKGETYLRTLAESQNRIKETLMSKDGSKVAQKFADRTALSRFATGCAWISSFPDEQKQQQLWQFWRDYWATTLAPSLNSRTLASTCFRLIIGASRSPKSYHLMRIVLSLTAPKPRLSSRFPAFGKHG